MKNRNEVLDNLVYGLVMTALANASEKKNAKVNETADCKCNAKCEGCVGRGKNDIDDDYVPPITKLIDRVIFDNPATIVFWADGDKTVVKCSENDTFSKEVGLAQAILKKVFGNGYYRQMTRVIDRVSIDHAEIRAKKAEQKPKKVPANTTDTNKVRKPRTTKEKATKETVSNT